MRIGERVGEEEDEVAEWQRWERGVRRCSYKETIPTFRIQGFLGNRTMICVFLNSSKRRGGPLPGLLRPISPILRCNLVLHTDCSPTSPQYHQCSVISTIQPLLWLFLHDLIHPRFPLVARGLHHHYDLVPHYTRDFLLVTIVFDPSTT